MNYANVIGYFVLEDDKFVPSTKDDVETFVSRTETGCEKDFCEWIMYAQNHLIKKHEEAKLLTIVREEKTKLELQTNTNKLNYTKTNFPKANK